MQKYVYGKEKIYNKSQSLFYNMKEKISLCPPLSRLLHWGLFICLGIYLSLATQIVTREQKNVNRECLEVSNLDPVSVL